MSLPVDNAREISAAHGYYALVRWHVSDIVYVFSRLGQDITEDQAKAWLLEHESRIEDRLISDGFEVLKILADWYPIEKADSCWGCGCLCTTNCSCSDPESGCEGCGC